MQNVGVVEMLDQRVRAIPIADCGEGLIDIGARNLIAYGPPPECPETAPFYRQLREGVVNRLERVQAKLPDGLTLRLYEGYRSPMVQKQLFEAQLRRVKERSPLLSARERYIEAAKLASPLTTFDGVAITPPHSTGGAVDIEIVDEAGVPIDFGMLLTDWGTVAPEVCATAFPDLPDPARRNRALLVHAMATEGFVNYPREWWHFSYGDQYWAHNLGRSEAIYGPVERSG